MDTFTAIRERRSVKHYDPQHVMSEDEIRKLLEAALLAPTSFNMQNWRFLVVSDPERKAALRVAASHQAQVADASITIALCAYLKAYENGPRYWADAPEPLRNRIVPHIRPFYENKPELQRDEAMRSVGMAGQNIMLAAKAMGYDSCPMIGFNSHKVAEVLGLPQDHVLGMLITVGKALKPANPRGGQLPYEEVVFRDYFPSHPLRETI